jgi:predicted O-linked N-acetylglucosamine transferase (SPINDLY family)
MENVGKTDIGQVLADMGIPRSRLVVSPLTEPEKHLERIRHANVFLDTYPCGAHTTASDSILGGVPVLNRMGDAFHTRVSASIMAHASAPEFICTSTEEYIEKAITCYQTPEILNDVKTKILDQTQVHHPYNIDTTTRAIEIGFKKMIEKADNLGSIKIDPW